MTSNSGDEAVDVQWRQRADDLVWREIDNEVIVLDLRSAQYLSLNAAGVVLWEALERERSEQQLAELLVERFEIDAEQARHDTRAFIDACAELQLLERRRTMTGLACATALPRCLPDRSLRPSEHVVFRR